VRKERLRTWADQLAVVLVVCMMLMYLYMF